MPPNKPRSRAPNVSSEPPKVMTWWKAAPLLSIAVVFDALKFIFSWFIIFGPAIGAGLCAYAASDYVGTTVSGLACGALGVTVGVVGSEAFGFVGVLLAMITGLAGWLAVVIILLATDSRMFSENIVWFITSLLVSEVPFAGSLPAITFVLWRLYNNQIKIEKAAYKKWQEENRARLRRESEELAQNRQQEFLARMSGTGSQNNEAPVIP